MDDTPSLLGAPSTVIDPLWYPDSDAIHHITHGSNNLTTKTIYNGNEFVKLGNGTSINISHIGSHVYKYPYTNAKMVLKSFRCSFHFKEFN